MSGDTVARHSLRVLALVTDAFGEFGGIAQYNRDFFSALSACETIGDVIVLPRRTAISPGELPARVRQLRSAKGRLAYAWAALRAARTHTPVDVVFCGHVYMAPLAAGIASLLRAPLWVQVHGVDAWDQLSALTRRSVEKAVLVTSVSRYTRRRLLEWIDIDPARVKVLPNTVDPQFRPGPKPDYLLDRHDLRGKKVLMTVSRLASAERYKGHDRVIRILPRILLGHPETVYLIVGDGDDRPRLEALAAECGVADKVRFTGLVPAAEMFDYFRVADSHVMPSTGEGFGIVFLEAVASGIDVIGGNSDGSVDALGDGALGAAVDPDNPEELAAAIRSSLDHPVRDSSRVGRFRRELFGQHLEALVDSTLPCSRESAAIMGFNSMSANENA
jgi:phosphatidyl-myo-inositol dimannoside synthase